MLTLKSLAAALALGIFALGGLAMAEEKGTIGVSMLSQYGRWVADGDNLVKELVAKGYKTDLQDAHFSVDDQRAQIERMIANKEKVLVIAAVDDTKLSGVLQKARDAGVKMIAYERLIVGSPNVDYFAVFDDFQAGVLQGQSIAHGLGLDADKTGPFNLEIFAGPADDSEAGFFYNGAMSVLRPLIDNGKLIVQSRQLGKDDVATPNWDPADAQIRMDALLDNFYKGRRVDAVLSVNDVLASGIIPILERHGYGSKRLPMPIITGCDAEVFGVKSIIAHEQYSTVFKDVRELAKVTAAMVDALASGGKPKVNDTTTYNNGVKVVPAYVVKPVLVDAGNWNAVLVDSGYYKADELQ